MTDQASALQALLDKQEITELLTRYLRSVDRGDLGTLRSCYLPGATEDHGGLFCGPASEYVDSITRDLTHPRPTRNTSLNIVVDPGFVVDSVYWDPPDQPQSPNPPRKWESCCLRGVCDEERGGKGAQPKAGVVHHGPGPPARRRAPRQARAHHAPFGPK